MGAADHGGPEQQAWNQALQIVAAERPNLTLWDWPAALAGIAIHLPTTPISPARRSTGPAAP